MAQALNPAVEAAAQHRRVAGAVAAQHRRAGAVAALPAAVPTAVEVAGAPEAAGAVGTAEAPEAAGAVGTAEAPEGAKTARGTAGVS
jgi:hypothetical protein